MSRFFSRTKKIDPSSTSATEETMSEPSDDQSQTSSINISDTSPRRGSILSALASRFRKDPESEFDLQYDCSIDEQLKCLYMDSDELEHKCRFDPKKFSALHGMSNALLTGSIPTDEYSSAVHLSSKKSPDSVIENLCEGFFTPEFDPVYMQLEQVSSWLDNEKCDLNSRFMDAIEEADTDKDMIMSRLAGLIEKNQHEIIASQNDIFSIDIDIARAATQISISRRKMRNVVDIMSQGSIKVTILQKKREKLLSIQGMLKSFNVTSCAAHYRLNVRSLTLVCYVPIVCCRC